MTTNANTSQGGYDQQGQHVNQQTNVVGPYSDNRTYIYNEASSDLLLKPASFDSYIKGKLENFVGRQFVFDAIDEFIKNTPAGGYFIIRGDPGIGKTTLVAKLVRDRGYIHHFNIATKQICRPQQFIRNISYQLAKRYNLPYETLPTKPDDYGQFLDQYLAAASANSGNQPIILIVASLDEADRSGLAPGTNSLYLPSFLPEGVFVILTTRYQEDLQLQIECSQEYFDIEPNGNKNEKDIKEYIANFIKQDAVQKRLAGTTEEDFIETMWAKSEGNFMYLIHVLPAYRNGLFENDLPQGLEDFYRRHWREMQEGKKEKFKENYAKIVCILGVAQEPVATEQIASWTTLPVLTVKESIGDWREFLIEEEKESVQLFRIYHKSFQDFLQKEVPPSAFHEMIADYYASQVTA